MGGDFTYIGGQSRNRIARIHGEEAFTSGILQFSAARYAISENAGAAAITVYRVGNTKNALSVDYSTSDGTAVAGQDYQPASGTLLFAAGETVAA